MFSVCCSDVVRPDQDHHPVATGTPPPVPQVMLFPAPRGRLFRLGSRTIVALVVARPENRLKRRAFPQNSWFSPPKTSLTEPSVKIWRIELVRSSAQERTRTFSGAPGGSGIVSVTTICSRPAAARFSQAFPEKLPCVAAA